MKIVVQGVPVRRTPCGWVGSRSCEDVAVLTRMLCSSLLFVLVVSPAAAQRNAFVLRSGSDTIAVEQFSRTAQGVDAEALVKVMGLRIGLSAVVGPDGLVRTLTNRAWMAADPADAPPRQVAVLTFQGDSVIADLTTGEQKTQQRLGTRAGALPLVNPTFSLFELLLERFRRAAADSAEYPGFMVAGGQTLAIREARRGGLGDSVDGRGRHATAGRRRGPDSRRDDSGSAPDHRAGSGAG